MRPLNDVMPTPLESAASVYQLPGPALWFTGWMALWSPRLTMLVAAVDAPGAKPMETLASSTLLLLVNFTVSVLTCSSPFGGGCRPDGMGPSRTEQRKLLRFPAMGARGGSGMRTPAGDLLSGWSRRSTRRHAPRSMDARVVMGNE